MKTVNRQDVLFTHVLYLKMNLFIYKSVFKDICGSLIQSDISSLHMKHLKNKNNLEAKRIHYETQQKKIA